MCMRHKKSLIVLSTPLKATGELIGCGGVHTKASSACGWPELGCKFGSEYLGNWYGTEFLCAFTKWWWDLPRYPEHGAGGQKPVPVRLRVHADSVVWGPGDQTYEGDIPIDTDKQAIEQLYAWVATDNYASREWWSKQGLTSLLRGSTPSRKFRFWVGDRAAIDDLYILLNFRDLIVWESGRAGEGGHEQRDKRKRD